MKKFVSIIVFALSLILIFSLTSLAKGTYEIHYGTWANPGEAAYEGMEQFKTSEPTKEPTEDSPEKEQEAK